MHVSVYLRALHIADFSQITLCITDVYIHTYIHLRIFVRFYTKSNVHYYTTSMYTIYILDKIIGRERAV